MNTAEYYNGVANTALLMLDENYAIIKDYEIEIGARQLDDKSFTINISWLKGYGKPECMGNYWTPPSHAEPIYEYQQIIYGLQISIQQIIKDIDCIMEGIGRSPLPCEYEDED